MSSIDFYNENVERYSDNIKDSKSREILNEILKYIPENGKILDAGCGTGRDSLIMKELGYEVTAFDGAYKMVELARKVTGLPVIVDTFENIALQNNTFDGIVALSSFIHVDKENMEQVFKKLYNSLKKEEYMVCSYKLGENYIYQEDGRKFTCYTIKEFAEFIEQKTQFTLIEKIIQTDARKGLEHIQWGNFILKKSF